MIFIGKRKHMKKDNSGYAFLIMVLGSVSNADAALGGVGYTMVERYVPQDVWDKITKDYVLQDVKIKTEMNEFGSVTVTDVCLSGTGK